MKQNDKTARNRLYTLIGVFLGVSYALYCLILSPLFFWLDSNVAFAGTVLPAVIHYTGVALELVAISVFYGVMIYGINRFGMGGFAGSIGIFAIATVVKYMLNVVMTWITYYSSMPTLWMWDLANVVFYSALEMIQLWLIVIIVRRILDKNEDGLELPTSVFDMGNAITKCALACGIVTAGVKLFGRLANDVWTMIISGLPQNPMTVVLMLLSYLSVAILGIICYTVTVFAATKSGDIVCLQSRK